MYKDQSEEARRNAIKVAQTDKQGESSTQPPETPTTPTAPNLPSDSSAISNLSIDTRRVRDSAIAMVTSMQNTLNQFNDNLN